jgi:hypothetical protein
MGWLVWAAPAAAQRGSAPDLAEILARVGAHVENYFQRAESLICEELVRVQMLGYDLLTDGRSFRQLLYDLRVTWEPPSDGGDLDPIVTRELKTVNGRPPRPRDKPQCTDPQPVSPEPLEMLLPAEQKDYQFKFAGRGRTDGRAALMLDYRALQQGEPEVVWKEECVSIELPGRYRGRIWIDSETYEVLRLDEHLVGIYDIDVPRAQLKPGVSPSMTVERADSTIRYRRVSFREPDETLMLPYSIDTLTVVRNSGSPRVRKTQRYSNYRRFVTEGRILP